MHPHFDLVREDRHDCNAKLRYPMKILWFQFLAVMGGTFGIYLLMENVKMSIPAIPRQYPSTDKKHYTFELE